MTSAKEFLNSKLHETEICVSRCQNLDAIKSATKHIQAAISVMSTMEQKTPSVLPIKRKVSPNENSERQRKFFTTRISSCTPLSRPSNEQKQLLRQTIQKEEPKFCGICFKEDDVTSDTEQIVEWIECDLCKLWVHTSCTKSKTDLENYIGDFCY